MIPRETLIERRPREGGDPVSSKSRRWTPAFAGMTTCSDDPYATSPSVFSLTGLRFGNVTTRSSSPPMACT
jgi:hypothetical protein